MCGGKENQDPGGGGGGGGARGGGKVRGEDFFSFKQERTDPG